MFMSRKKNFYLYILKLFDTQISNCLLNINSKVWNFFRIFFLERESMDIYCKVSHGNYAPFFLKSKNIYLKAISNIWIIHFYINKYKNSYYVFLIFWIIFKWFKLKRTSSSINILLFIFLCVANIMYVICCFNFGKPGNYFL